MHEIMWALLGATTVLVIHEISAVIEKRKNKKSFVAVKAPEPEKLSDIIEKQFLEQCIEYDKALTIWSNLYNKVHWKEGTIREIVAAELVIDDARSKMKREEYKRDQLEEKFKEAIRNELLDDKVTHHVKNP